jgi:pyruvate dehydrogenase phosphatase
MAADWACCVAEAAAEAPSVKGENLALRLLRHALGGEDLMSISQMVTLDMDTPWMDDTTIIVQAL